MTDFVLREVQHWNTSMVSERELGIHTERLTPHKGEWFTLACAAYARLRGCDRRLALCLYENILQEMEREASLWKFSVESGSGIDCLKASFILSHNMGDLDRVMDLWELEEDDPLRRDAYKATSSNQRWATTLGSAGKLNCGFMAKENHRHLALRKPRALRRSRDLLLPIGPFFDEWGANVGQHPSLKEEEIAEIVEALIYGYHRLAKSPSTQGSVGYARALRGILETFPGGESRLIRYLPARFSRALRKGTLRQQMQMTQTEFEASLNSRALKFLNSPSFFV